jgi:hypothetical protein
VTNRHRLDLERIITWADQLSYASGPILANDDCIQMRDEALSSMHRIGRALHAQAAAAAESIDKER